MGKKFIDWADKHIKFYIAKSPVLYQQLGTFAYWSYLRHKWLVHFVLATDNFCLTKIAKEYLTQLKQEQMQSLTTGI